MRHFLIGMFAVTMSFTLTTTVYAAGAVAKTVEAVNLEKDQLKDQQVQLHGKVVKVNNGIMKRNFIHLQDGTGEGENNKLVLTSDQTANVGDEITVTGTVSRNIDFGMGYKYDLLIEKAVIAGK